MRVESPPASSERPLPLVARKDLQATAAEYAGEMYWVVKDPVRLEYFRLSREQHAILELLDGSRSLEAIRAEFLQRFPARRLTLSQVRRLVFDLYDKGLAWSSRPGQTETLLERGSALKRKRWLAAARSLFFIRLPGWDPHELLERIYPIVRGIFHPAAVLMAVFLFAAACGFLLIRVDEIYRRAPAIGELATWQMLAATWLVLGAAKVLHELGHALACRHFGGECHEIGLAFLIFSPCLYCDVSDSWLLASKWKRIAVAAAGMYVEIVLFTFALVAWWNTRPGAVHDAALVLLVVTSVSTIAFNLNPLLRLDGYYILSDWLEIPNLRRAADRLLETLLMRCCLGVRPPDPAIETARSHWLVPYAIASLVYRWLVCFAICFILYQVLDPVGLGHLGLLLGIASALTAIVLAALRLGRLVATHWSQLSSLTRPAATLVLLAGVVGISLLVPVPVHVNASLAVAPRAMRHVYVTTPGRIEAVHARPGERVRRGDVLVRLANDRRVAHLRQLRTAAAAQQIEVDVQEALGDAAQSALARETLRALAAEVAEYERQVARLTIVAPCDGVVIAPVERRSPQGKTWKTLPTWNGSPLDVANRGSFLEAGTHVVSIAPSDRYEAVLRIEEPDRHDFRVGQDVKVQMDHLPGVTLRSRIGHVAHYAVERENSSRAGGPRAVAGRVHEAVVPLACERLPLVPGMRGRAGVLVTHRSAAGWLWRYVCETLQFLV